jgi:hypothetical protein
MSVDQPESRRITSPLAPWAGAGLSSAQTAEAVMTAWHAIDDALTPVIGARGLVALYLRALHLTAADPALAAAGQPAKMALNAANTPELLQALIARQTPAHATAIGNTFLQVFYGLLSSLIGPSLTERLLRAVWASSLSSTSAQDRLP